MSAIIIPRKHYTQPQGRVAIAPEWADGFIGAFLPHEQSPEWVITGSGAELVPTREGVMLRSTSTTTYASKTVAEHQNTGYTMLTSGVTRNNMSKDYAGVYNGGTYQGLLYNALSSKKFSYFFKNGSLRTFSSAPEITNLGGNEFTVIGGGDGANHRGALMQDGALFSESGTYTGTSAYDSVYSGARFNAGALLSTTLTAFWRNLLAAEAMRALALNPYQIFRADPVRIYSLPSVITIPTLSSPGVIDITATSARPQVTLSY